MSTEYKGFTISLNNELRHVVAGRSFRKDGYATLGAAFAAITKHLNAQATVVPAANVETDITTAGTAKVKLAGSGDKEYASVPAVQRVTPSRNKREGGYAGKRAEYRVSYDDTVTKVPAKHWRAHPSKSYDTLKSYAKFMQSLDKGE